MEEPTMEAHAFRPIFCGPWGFAKQCGLCFKEYHWHLQAAPTATKQTDDGKDAPTADDRPRHARESNLEDL